LVVAAGCIVGTDRDAFAEGAHLTAGAGVAATAAVFVVTLGIDTMTIAVCLGVGALTLAKFARTPRLTGMATGATVVGVGRNVGARSIAADLVGGT
jgi:hypothetical protein